MIVRIEKFYEADPRRSGSEEVTFGNTWKLASEPELSWNVFWLRDTGELVAYQTARYLAPSGSSQWSGTLLGDIVMGAVEVANSRDEKSRHQSTRHEELTILTVDTDESLLHQSLDGWQEHLESADGFTWMLTITANHTPESESDGPGMS